MSVDSQFVHIGCSYVLVCSYSYIASYVLVARGESVMHFEPPIILSGNSFQINLLFLKLFPQKAAFYN